MIAEHLLVVLNTVPNHEKLNRGDVGTVVHVYENGKAYEVEFVDFCIVDDSIFCVGNRHPKFSLATQTLTTINNYSRISYHAASCECYVARVLCSEYEDRNFLHAAIQALTRQ